MLCVAVGCAIAAGCTNGKAMIREDREAFDAGYAAFEAGRWQRAVDDFTRYLRSDPLSKHRGEVYYYRGQCQAHLGYRGEALDDFERAIGAKAGQPIDSFARVAIGNIYYEQGNDAKAIEAYAEALRDPPKELPLDTVLLRVGVSLQRLGRWATADKYLAHLIDHHPDSPAAAEARRRLHADAFTVQVGAFASMMTAQNEAARVRGAGFVPCIVRTTRGSQTLNAVHVGRARTYAEAATLARRLSQAGFQTVIVP
jgi:tetratricopeptide (TPR) repeat protein